MDIIGSIMTARSFENSEDITTDALFRDAINPIMSEVYAKLIMLNVVVVQHFTLLVGNHQEVKSQSTMGTYEFGFLSHLMQIKTGRF